MVDVEVEETTSQAIMTEETTDEDVEEKNWAGTLADWLFGNWW